MIILTLSFSKFQWNIFVIVVLSPVSIKIIEFACIQSAVRCAFPCARLHFDVIWTKTHTLMCGENVLMILTADVSKTDHPFICDQKCIFCQIFNIDGENFDSARVKRETIAVQITMSCGHHAFFGCTMSDKIDFYCM